MRRARFQALDREQPVLPMMPGVPERRTHSYVRHGTTSLFAALDVASGFVIGKCYKRRRGGTTCDRWERLRGAWRVAFTLLPEWAQAVGMRRRALRSGEWMTENCRDSPPESRNENTFEAINRDFSSADLQPRADMTLEPLEARIAPAAAAVFHLADLDGLNGLSLYSYSSSVFAGRSASGAGDVNGDGFDDFIVGVPRFDNFEAGAVYVVFGKAGGFSRAIDPPGTRWKRRIQSLRRGFF